MTDETAAERLYAAAAHARCVAGRAKDGWLIEGMSVRLRDQPHDKSGGQVETPSTDCPVQT